MMIRERKREARPETIVEFRARRWREARAALSDEKREARARAASEAMRAAWRARREAEARGEAVPFAKYAGRHIQSGTRLGLDPYCGGLVVVSASGRMAWCRECGLVASRWWWVNVGLRGLDLPSVREASA